MHLQHVLGRLLVT